MEKGNAESTAADSQPTNEAQGAINTARPIRSSENSRSNSAVTSPTKGSGTITDEEDSRHEEQRKLQKEIELTVDKTREVQIQNEDEPEVTAEEEAIAGTDQITEIQQPVFPTHMHARQSQDQVSYCVQENMAKILTFLPLCPMVH